jgi:hypothetical protein
MRASTVVERRTDAHRPLFASEDVGEWEFSGKVGLRAATNVAATLLAATNSIRILPRLL